MNTKQYIENKICILKEEKDRCQNCEMPDWVAVAEIEYAIIVLKEVLRFIDNNKKGDEDD